MNPCPCPCAGFIVYKSPGLVAVVSTKKGNHSLPKGKRKKGESEFTAAKRELFEETGIELLEEEITDREPYVETTDKGNPSVKYFYAKVSNDKYSVLKPCDPDELSDARWVKVEDLHKLKVSKKSRQIAFEEIVASFQ